MIKSLLRGDLPYTQRYAPFLWIASGVVCMIPSVLGAVNPLLISIGALFLVLGMVGLKNRNSE